MNELALAALHQRGKPSTAADIFDTMIGLGQAAQWPREVLAKWSTQRVAKLLENMARGDSPSVHISGHTMENGNRRNVWAPVTGFTSGYPTPDPPVEKAEHPIDGMTRPQQLAVFEVTDNLLYEFRRQRRELLAFMNRQDEELARQLSRAKQTLAAIGLPE